MSGKATATYDPEADAIGVDVAAPGAVCDGSAKTLVDDAMRRMTGVEIVGLKGPLAEQVIGAAPVARQAAA